ncbi:hypothetical protein MBLNU459_g8371t1 [Dothideomycetes sp. NU459]
MGLAGPKKRTKLSHDPNNNAWARSTTSFGHKILSSQGWTPGETLGAKDAAHASHYTKASNSHIRVLLKDDNLGLGASLAGNRADTFGLSLFSGILGRLNGKSDTEVEKEQRKEKDVELALYQGRKYGTLNFVSAGYLVGDKIEKSMSTNMTEVKAPAAVDSSEGSVPEAAVSAGNKRKRSEPDTKKENESESDSSSAEDTQAELARKSKKSKKSRRSKGDSSEDEPERAKRKEKNRKTDKKRKASDGSSSEDESRAERKARRAERRARKEERRRRKEIKRASKTATPLSAPATPAEPADGPVAVVAVKTEVAPQAAAPFIGRHAVRQRYIAQKRLASLNPQALKEIFMVKTPS